MRINLCISSDSRFLTKDSTALVTGLPSGNRGGTSWIKLTLLQVDSVDIYKGGGFKPIEKHTGSKNVHVKLDHLSKNYRIFLETFEKTDTDHLPKNHGETENIGNKNKDHHQIIFPRVESF